MATAGSYHPQNLIYEIGELTLLTLLIVLSFVVFIKLLKLLRREQFVFANIGVGLFMALGLSIIMRSHIHLPNGSTFDGSSVFLIIVAYFYGIIPTIMVLITGIAFTFFLDFATLNLVNALIYSGMMIFTVLFTIFWKKSIVKRLKIACFMQFWILGMIVNTILFLVFALTTVSQDDILNVAIPMLVIFPFSVAIGAIFTQQQEFFTRQSEYISHQKTLIDATVNATNTMEIYAVDNNYQYLSFNKFHAAQIKRFWNITIKVGDNFLKVVKDVQIRERLKTNLDRALTGEEFEQNIEVETRKGKFLEEHFTAIYDENKDIIGVTVFSHEITERKKYEQNITYLSYHDLLTGLKNRRYYDDRIAELSTLSTGAIVIYVDINALKIMNDAFGHNAGDELLKTVSNALAKAFGDIGDVCRIGGDEIIILLPKYSLAQARTITDIFKNELEKKVVQELQVSVSIGVAEAKTGDQIRTALLRAEDEMYKNKLIDVASHRNTILTSVIKKLNQRFGNILLDVDKITEYALLLADKLNFTELERNLLRNTIRLRDIGKIAIPRDVLNKKSKLTDEEYELVKKHAEIGYRMLSGTTQYADIAYDVLAHHENFDGSGYPRKLRGEEIPIRARIVNLVVAYVAMNSELPYRPALGHEHAIAEIKKLSGLQFDPKLVDHFLTIFK